MGLLAERVPEESFDRGIWEELAGAVEDVDAAKEVADAPGKLLAPGSASSSAYSIVGSWSSWSRFDDLAKVTSSSGAVVYSASLPVRGGEVEEFQISVRRSFQRLYFPESSAPGAKVLGPGAGAHGRNWRLEVPPDCATCTLFWEPIARAVWWEFGPGCAPRPPEAACVDAVAPPPDAAEPSALDAALLRAKEELEGRALCRGPSEGLVVATPDALCDAMCDLAAAYSDPGLQKLLRDIREREDFLELLRELILPRQAPVLERLGLPVSSEGLSKLEAKVIRCICKEKHLDLQRMANGALHLLKLPPICRKVPDALLEESLLDPLDLISEEGERRGFWRSLCPWLHVGDAGLLEAAKRQAGLPARGAPGAAEEDRRAAGRREELAREGHFVVPAGALSWDALVAAVARGVGTLRALGLPPEFILAYDEPWVLAALLEPIVSTVLGGAQITFDWAVRCAEVAVQPPGGGGATSSSDNGQSPCRGLGLRAETSGLDCLNPDGSPRYTTFSIALTDSTPRNSCLMVVPRPHDAGYSIEEPDMSEICGVFREPEDFQHITALPVAAGAVVGVSSRLFCWDSFADRDEEPRIALALGVADPAYRPGAFGDPAAALPLPPLGVRLSLAAAHLLRSPGQALGSRPVDRLELLSELFHANKEPLSEAFQVEVVAATTALYERLDLLESGPTLSEEDVGRPLPLFEAAQQRDPYAQAASVVSLPRELDVESDPFEILAAQGDNAALWKRLCPWLHVCSETMAAVARWAVFPCAQEGELSKRCLGLKENLIQDGYFSVEGGVLPWAVDLSGVARGILELVGRGFPAICILMYDEPWVLAAQLEQLAWVATGGNELSFDWAAFCVRAEAALAGRGPGADAGEDDAAATIPARAGWPPHRDRGSNSAAARGFRADGSPRYTTFWIPLTDATPLSSCLHVVPRATDPGYRAGDGRNSAIQNVFRRPEDFRRIRAVPLAAGGLLAFTHRIFHWGSAAHSDAPEPRIAVAFPAVDPSFETPLFPEPEVMRPMPPLDIRLGLAAAQVMVYAANERHLVSTKRLERCWSIFHMRADAFHPTFVRGISETNTAQHQRLVSAEEAMPSYVL